MKKICCVLIFLILVPAFSYAEISGNLDGFKKSNFFIKYKFSPDAKPYTVNARTFIDFYQKETLDKVMIELDSKSNRIIKQIGYLKDKGTVGELIMDFITEATGGKVEDKTIADLLNEFNAGFKKEGKLELGEIYWLKGDRESAKEVLNKLRSVDRFKYWADKLETIMQKE